MIFLRVFNSEGFQCFLKGYLRALKVFLRVFCDLSQGFKGIQRFLVNWGVFVG